MGYYVLQKDLECLALCGEREKIGRQVKGKLIPPRGSHLLAGSAALHVGAGREEDTVCSWAVLDGAASS